MQGKEKLAQLLKSNLPSERDAAIYEVKRSLLGESEKVFLLKTLMEDESSLVRQSLAETLAEFEGGLSADILKKLLKDADPTVRLMALKSFSKAYKADDYLLFINRSLINDTNFDVKTLAAELIGNVGPTAETSISSLKEVIFQRKNASKLNEVNFLITIADTLFKIGTASIPGLMDLTDEKNDDYIRCLAVETLGRFGPKAKPAIRCIIICLRHQDPTLRINAAMALGKIGPKAQIAIPEMVNILEDSQSSVRISSAMALGSMGPEAANYLPRIFEVLAEEDSFILEQVAGAVSKMGEGIVPYLLEALKSEKITQRIFAAQLLARVSFEDSKVLGNIIEGLDDENVSVKMYLLEALKKLGIKGEKAVPKLIETLKYDNKELRDKVVFVLGKLGEKSTTAVESLVGALKFQEVNIRIHASLCLSMIGGPAVPFLKSCLKDKREFVRCLAAETLGEIGEEAVEAVEEIKDALSDENRQVVLHSIMALSSIGEKARAALPKLRGLLRSIDPYIKEAAEEAIEKIAAKK